MNTEACGVLLYVRGHEGRGIGLANKIRAYKLQDQGLDTVEANLRLGLPVDERTYDEAVMVLANLGVSSIRLFTNNPEKVHMLKSVTKEVVALASIENERNSAYLRTKRERLNHRTVLETFKLPPVQAETSKMCVGIVYTTWNEYYVNALVHTAQTELEHKNVRIVKLPVPGATDLISGCRAIKRQHDVDAVIVFGVLIRGRSDVYDVTCNAVMVGLTELNASQDVPIILGGLLMCRDEDQAHERSHGRGNPAKAVAETAIHMASMCAASEKKRIEFSRQSSPGARSDARENGSEEVARKVRSVSGCLLDSEIHPEVKTAI